VRPLIEKFFKPREYIGVDIEEGKFVDIVCDAENLVDYFCKETFDVVIATELLEHVKDWRKVINNMKEVLKPNGYIYITTRSKGFPYHGYPYDFWRYEIEDMKEIFKDFEIIKLEKEPDTPGVFLKARKPKDCASLSDLSEISLYSIILGKRTKEIITKFPFQRKCKIFIQNLMDLIKNKLKGILTLK
jgi:SAM-dependent methyltransferase